MESMKRIPFSLFLVAISLGYAGYAGGINRSIQNIEAFTRLYGYVRYFYPGDEAAALNWEKFAIYAAKKVEGAQNDEALKKILEELFLPIAPTLKITKSGQETHFSVTDITPPQTDGMNVVAWQHYGLGFGKADSIYKSVRLNILKNTDSSYLQLFARRIKERITTADITVADQVIKTTCSIGYVQYPFYDLWPKLFSFEKTVQVADWGLYHAKHNGRNMAVNLFPGANIPDEAYFGSLSRDLDDSLKNGYLSLNVIR